MLEPWQNELQAVLDSWQGTRYASGQGLRGRVADCIGFVAGVLDELHGYDLPPPERHAPDTALHNPRLAAEITLRVSRRWPHRVIRGWDLEYEPLEPGDVLICRVGRSPTGHVMIVGTRTHEVWHCDNGDGVCYTGIGQVADRIIRVWRPTEKHTWRRRC